MATTSTATGIHFYYFSAFPAEVRDAIWEQCLPSRIVDIDRPNPDSQISDIFDDKDQLNCDFYWPSSRQYYINSCYPPLISRVCHESRNVAMRNGGWVQMGWDVKVWLDPARDVLHLNWNHYADDLSYPYCKGLIRSFLGAQAKHLSISYCLCTGGFHYEEGRDVLIHRLLQQRPSYELCLEAVSIHVTHTGQHEPDSVSDPIVSSGLFGIFGEERVKEVDARDYGQLERFATFNQEHGSPQDSRATEFFENYYKTNNVQKKMDALRLQWLQEYWKEAKKIGIPIKDCETVWPRYLHSPNVLNMDAPNLDHLWVKTVLQEMPIFHPVYMIRVCTQNCK